MGRFLYTNIHMSTTPVTPTMTPKDWELVQQAYDQETQLLKTMNEVKVLRGDRKKDVEMKAKKYSRFIKENEGTLARVFGDEEVVKDMYMSVTDIMVNRLGLAA